MLLKIMRLRIICVGDKSCQLNGNGMKIKNNSNPCYYMVRSPCNHKSEEALKSFEKKFMDDFISGNNASIVLGRSFHSFLIKGFQNKKQSATLKN